MVDPTEATRRQLVQQINGEADERTALDAKYGQVWNTEELSRDFEPIGFLAPFIVVRRKIDGMKGSLTFQHSPRYYFEFREDK